MNFHTVGEEDVHEALITTQSAKKTKFKEFKRQNRMKWMIFNLMMTAISVCLAVSTVFVILGAK